MKNIALMGILFIFIQIKIIAQVADNISDNTLYLGQEPPGMTPEIFAPGIISKAGFHMHSCLAFSPDGNEIYFTKRSYEPNIKDAICFMKKVENEWSSATLAPFSEEFNNDSPVFTPDGNILYFSSDRPVSDNDTTNDLNFWYIEKSEDNWSEPILAPSILNTDSCDFRLSFSKNGNIYLSSNRDPKNNGSFDIYVVPNDEGKYHTITKLDITINTSLTEQIGFVAPDESYLVFYRYNKNKPDDVGLYISFRNKNGSWTNGRNMGEIFNSPTELCTQAASLSPDGKFIFFLRRYDEAVYWVSANIIEQYR